MIRYRVTMSKTLTSEIEVEAPTIADAARLGRAAIEKAPIDPWCIDDETIKGLEGKGINQ